MRPLPHTDNITIIRAPHRRLAKLITADSEIIGYDRARQIDATQIQVSSLADVRALLDRLLHRPDCAIVRGEIIAGTHAERIRRLAYLDATTGDEPTLRDVPRRWLALDMDGVERPEAIPAHDLLGCAEAVLERLPAPFWRASCIVQASASHGIKPGCRLRLIFWCDRPMGGAELKRWLPMTDTSVFRPVQPIYTAAPVFGSGRADHLPFRLAEYPGEDWLQCPSPEMLAPLPAPPIIRSERIATGINADAYTRGALTRAADAILNAGEGRRHETIVGEARTLARLVTAGLLAESDMRAVLTRAAEAAGKTDHAEINSAIGWGLSNPGGTAMPEARHAA